MSCWKECAHVSNLSANTSPKRFEPVSGEKIGGLGEHTVPYKTNEGIQRCITFRSASVVKTLISMLEAVRVGDIVALDEKNLYIRNTSDGTMINLDVNHGV